MEGNLLPGESIGLRFPEILPRQCVVVFPPLPALRSLQGVTAVTAGRRRTA